MQHGGFYSGPDQYNPGTLQNHKWENALKVDIESWGIRRDIRLPTVRSMDALIEEIASTVSCGGNILINVGPTKEGTIIPIFEERLRQVGDWSVHLEVDQYLILTIGSLGYQLMEKLFIHQHHGPHVKMTP